MAAVKPLSPRCSRRRSVVALACLLLAGCGSDGSGADGAPASPGPAWFEEVTPTCGIDHVHAIGQTGTWFMPEIMGPGCALFDADGDGDLDAYVVNAGPARSGAPNRLFRQEAPGRFVDATEASGLGDAGYGMGVAVGDVDNDGDLDVYVTNHGPDALYRNRGDGTFEDATREAGIDSPGWSSSAAFVDFDVDGDLDLYVAGYLVIDPARVCPDAAGRPDYCGPRTFPGARDALYENDGKGVFTDVGEASGIGRTGRRGLGVVCADVTGDGRPEIYVANDNEANQLWVRQPDGTFRDEALFRGVALNLEGREEASMGLVWEDLDGDLDLDLFMTHLRGESNTLFVNEGAGRYADGTSSSGLLAPSMRFTGFGAAAVDVDQDGLLDVVTVNGHVFRAKPQPGPGLSPFWSRYAQTGQVFRQRAPGWFVDVSDAAGTFGTSAQVGRGLAVGDVDGDGALDLLVSATGGRARLYLNRVPDRGRWLHVRARDPALKRDVPGALVTVVVGDRRMVRRLDPAHSYLSSSDAVAAFGLGTAARYDAIEVRWPGGKVERFPGGAADRRVTVRRGEGS